MRSAQGRHEKEKSFMKYYIYSHADADGGIAAAIFSKFLLSKYKHIDSVFVRPVNHVSSRVEWPLQEIHWPCSILDFTLHPTLLSSRFFPADQLGIDCYWIDHHPTGSYFPFLREDNVNELVDFIKVCWDTTATSTPGLFRTRRKDIGIPDDLIKKYEEFIDIAEIIDGALYATCEAAYDFSDPAVKIQTLFSASHPGINSDHFYTHLVDLISKTPKVEEFLASDPLFSGVVAWEQSLHQKRLAVYERVLVQNKKVAVADFSKEKGYSFGLGRFIPFLQHPEASYALHIIPKKDNEFSLACGINPWTMKKHQNKKHLGAYFRKHFQGGGHNFVAGGRVSASQFKKVEELIQFLNKEED